MVEGKDGVTIPRWQYILILSLLIANSFVIIYEHTVGKPKIDIHFYDERGEQNE